MATKIRLHRMGAKKKPFYRLVVCDAATRRDGRPIEEIGYYDPTKNPHEISINELSALKWLNEGAQPSDTAKSLLRQAGIMQKYHNMKNS
ncbi:MAG: 30S ribosomal protein S16 [Peptococcaceae bacterium]|nr:30S ribosomal protein S16 [Peptococcaceae bacterium]MDR2736640.1 30S ribosomal protein S16 [Gracilibacteraceae bacterium]